MSDENCADCGGFDIEWMHKCFKHGAFYCCGCECPYCADDAYEEDYDPTRWCDGCGAMVESECDCGPIAEND